MTYTDPQTKEYWLRVFAALKFVEGYSTEQLEGRTLGEALSVLRKADKLLWEEGYTLSQPEIADISRVLSHFSPAPSDNQEEQSDG